MTKLTYTDHVVFPVLLFIAASFPLPIAFSSTGVILLLIVFFADPGNFRSNLLNYYSNKKNLLLLAIFCCLSLSLLYSDDKDTGQKGILAAVSLIALPLSLTIASRISAKQIMIIKKLFVFSCFITSLVYLALAIKHSGLIDGSYKTQATPENYLSYLVGKLTYNPLSPSIHAIFFSLYIALAVFIIVFEIRKPSALSKTLYVVLMLYFLIYLFLLTSVTINFALYSFFLLYFYFQFTFKKWQHYLIFFSFLIAGTAVATYLFAAKYAGSNDVGIYKFDSVSVNNKIVICFVLVAAAALAAILIKIFLDKKYIYILTGIFLLGLLTALIYRGGLNESSNDKKVNNISARVKYGAAALRIIKKNPFLGVGIGDKKNDHVMKEEELPEGSLPAHPFNSHNQFLDFWLAAGIIPMICFIIYLINVCRQAIKHKHTIYMALAFCFCLFCFTDAAMMVQRGQVFFLFFVSLFEFESKRKTEQAD
jgi:hypothetical protein